MCSGFNSTWNAGLPRNATLYTVLAYFVDKVIQTYVWCPVVRPNGKVLLILKRFLGRDDWYFLVFLFVALTCSSDYFKKNPLKRSSHEVCLTVGKGEE